MVINKESKPVTRTPEKMFPLIQSWEASDLSQKDFCALHHLKPHVFWYWLRRYREREKAGQSQQNFIPIKVGPKADKRIFAEIIYPDGTRLLLNEAVDLKVLRSLLPKV